MMISQRDINENVNIRQIRQRSLLSILKSVHLLPGGLVELSTLFSETIGHMKLSFQHLFHIHISLFHPIKVIFQKNINVSKGPNPNYNKQRQAAGSLGGGNVCLKPVLHCKTKAAHSGICKG